MKYLLCNCILLFVLAVTTPNAVCGDDPKKDPDQIGSRNVSGKVNFYSVEKEIALGKGLAQQVERQAKIINDPMIAEYVNRVGPESGAQFGRQGSIHHQGDR